MNVIYLRTFFVSYVLFIALCVIVIASLWWQNRKRFPEIALWLTNYIFQFIALLLVSFRGIIPDFFSIVLANFFIIGGTIILYVGLCRYVGTKTSQLHNIMMLTVFMLVHAYLTYIYPSAAWRTINQSVALIFICSQASWLMLRGTESSLRSATRVAGVFFAILCLIGVIQIIVNLTIHESHDIIVSGSFGIVATMMYQISSVALTFALFIMVTRRLSIDLERRRLQREQEEKIIRTRLSLLEFAITHSLDEVLQKTLDEVGDMVESPIGFYHFVEEDQKTLSLQAWSTRTLNEFCKAGGKGMHYAIDQAGVWTDCVHQKQAVIHNDYLSLPHRKGMPEGHAAVIRELVVPIMRGGKVMAILGVGNKPSDYDEKDVEIISYLADVAWEITRRKKAEEAVSKYSNDLKERLKEMNCLYSISEIFQKAESSEEEILKQCPSIIAQAYQFPEITACRILIGEHEYHTDNFRQTPWSQNRTINVNDEPAGSVEVCYLEERPKEYEGPFLSEESNLLTTVADILGRYIKSKKAEEALRSSEEKFKQLADVFPETIFEANTKGDITYANPHGLKKFGFTEEDIARGINIFDYVSSYDRKLVQERIQNRIKGDEKSYLEYQALKKDGSTFHALALSVPFAMDDAIAGIRGFILDITSRKKAEETLRQSEARLQAITNSANEAIIMMDNHGNISYWNPAAERILGYSEEEAMGKNLHHLIVPERFMPAHLAAFPEFQKTGQGNAIGKTLELFARRKDGGEIAVELSLSAVKIEGAWHAVGIVQDITERKQVEEQIKHLATHDLLTDLPSLRLAMDRLASALNLARRYKKAAAVMFIDLDGFKAVNDTLGHDAGDYVLKEVAQRLLSCVRETDTVARVGGDEFLIIATEIQSPDNAEQIAKKVIQTVSQSIVINDQQATVGASIGIALFPDHSEDMDKLIKLADEAMYKVKNAGKNGYRFVNS